MTSSSQFGGEPPSQHKRFWLILLSRPVVGFLIALLAVLAGITSWLWVFVHDQLVPLIAQNLSQTLNRPVELGSVERFTPVSIRFGSSAIPVFSKQVDSQQIKDPDSLKAESISVAFNVLDVLLTRTLNLDVTVAKPNLYVEQAADGRWLTTEISPRESTGPIKTNLQAVRFRDAKVVLVPQGVPAQTFAEANGKLIFVSQAKRIKFDLAAQLQSGGNLKTQGEWLRPSEQVSLSAQAEDLKAIALTQWLPQLPIRAKAGLIDANLRLKYRQNQPFTLAGTAQVKSATVVVPDRLLLRSLRTPTRTFQKVNGTIKFLENSPAIGFDLQGLIAAGGALKVKGQTSGFDFKQINLSLQAQNLAATVLDGAFKLPISPRSGKVDGNLAIQLRSKQQPNIQGTAQLKNVTAQIAAIPQPFSNTTGQLRFQGGLTTVLEQVKGFYGQVPFQANGSIDPKAGYNLTAQSSPVEISKALQTLNLRSPIATAGQVLVQDLRVTGPIRKPLLSGLVTTPGTPLIGRVPFRSLRAQFQVNAPLVQITNIQGIPTSGGIVRGQARYNLRPGQGLIANLRAQNLSGDAIAQLYGVPQTIDVGSVNAQATISGPAENIQTAVRFQAPAATYATTGEVIVSNGQAQLQNIVAQVAGGTVRGSGRIVNGLLRATVETAGVPLKSFSAGLRGQLRGQLNFSGPIAALRPENIRAQGNVLFSQGLSVVQAPLRAQVRFNGQNIIVQQATAPGLRAQGVIATRFQGGAPQITALDLNVRAQDYSLQDLPALGPTAVQLVGLADLNGRLTGTPAAPNFNGSLQVNNLALNQLNFEPYLAGKLNYNTGQGVNLNLAGQQDQINLVLGPKLRPKSFYLQRDQAVAVGRTQGDQLLVDVQQFPLASLNLRPGAQSGLGPIAGLASGDFAVNLNRQTLNGNLVVEQPSLGTIIGDRFVSQVRYADGVATLSGGKLQLGSSQYLLTGTLKPGTNPQFNGQLNLAQGKVQDILAALQIFEIQDLRRGLVSPTYGKAADVQPEAVGLPEAPLLTQLRRLSEIEVLLAEQKTRRQEASPLPELADLTGQLNGQVNFSGSLQAGIEADFNLQGQNIDWGPYAVDQIVADGSFANGVIDLRPLRVSSGDRLAAFTGKIGGNQQAGQLVLNNVSVETLSQFVDLPIAVTGDLDGTATLAGSLANPQIQGQLNLADATLNETPVKTAQATFNYNNARLSFDSTTDIAGPEPVQIVGSIPYQLPFASVSPSSDRISLDLNVKNEGLALLNLFTDQVAWVKGQGLVNLQVQGTLNQPVVNGIATLNNATLRAQALPETLTDVNGTIRFNRDRIQVERLNGQYNQGQVAATGVIPVFAPLSASDPDRATPLMVNLNQLALRVKNLYSGDVDGNLVVTGTALSPELGGVLQLSDGQVLLANTPGINGDSPVSTPTSTRSEESPFSPVRFNNLQVNLGDDLQITYPPILNFLASGDIVLNGNLNSLQPQGKVDFKRGQVNLFTTRFRLNRRKQNYAEFLPGKGLDPNLNVNLIASVTEVTRPPTDATGIVETNTPSALGALESVRIRAEVKGQASELIDDFRNNVELTSSPSRSQEQIVALIGGGFAENQSGEQSTLALANLAGSAFLNNIQGFLDNALGSRVDFRLFPTLIPTESDRSTLALGAELGYDVTDRLSASILQVLTSPDNPTQLNARYQLTDKIQVRSGISLDGEAIGVVEYRTRF